MGTEGKNLWSLEAGGGEDKIEAYMGQRRGVGGLHEVVHKRE